MLLYVHRDRTDYLGKGAQDTHLDFHTAPGRLNSYFFGAHRQKFEAFYKIKGSPSAASHMQCTATKLLLELKNNSRKQICSEKSNFTATKMSLGLVPII